MTTTGAEVLPGGAAPSVISPEVIVDASALTPGWYCIGFEDGDGRGVGINWDSAPIFEYRGEGEWYDENGELVECFWDPYLQLTVATNAADAYLRQ